MANLPVVKVDDAVLRFRNFSGREGKFNAEGVRSFVLMLDPDEATNFKTIGFNVKELPPRDATEEPSYCLRVAVRFEPFPPKIYLISKGVRTELTEETVHCLDFADIKKASVAIRPREYNVNGNVGVKAYLKTLYVELEEDEFENQYSFDSTVKSSQSVPESVEEINEDELPF